MAMVFLGESSGGRHGHRAAISLFTHAETHQARPRDVEGDFTAPGSPRLEFVVHLSHLFPPVDGVGWSGESME